MAYSFMDFVRNFLSRPLGTTMDTTGKSRSVPHPMLIDTWIHVVMSCLRGWTSESIAMWQELTGYRLEKASHCKATTTRNEHEFVIYEFRNDKRQKLELRTDRSAGERKRTMSTSSLSPSMESIVTNFTDFEAPSPRPSPRSSRLSLPLKGSISKVTSSIRKTIRRLSEDSLPRPSAMSSNQYLAADTVTRINGLPSDSQVLRTITFRGDRSSRPNLWDVMILVSVVHQESTTYKLLERQCYWFADTIFGLLEKWAMIHEDGSVSPTEKRRVKWFRGLASTGTLGVVPVYRRDTVHIDKIWDKFAKERHIMDNQREEYEESRKEEIRKASELAGQVAKLQFEQAKERQEREKERRERDEKEQQMRKEQEEREQRLKRQQEAERQLRKEQEEMVRRLEEESRLLNQQIADQERQLREMDRQRQMLLQQKGEEAYRRFKHLEQRITRSSMSI